MSDKILTLFKTTLSTMTVTSSVDEPILMNGESEYKNYFLLVFLLSVMLS